MIMKQRLRQQIFLCLVAYACSELNIYYIRIRVLYSKYVLPLLFCRWAQLYFLAWYLISVVMAINLFVALILEVRSLVNLCFTELFTTRK